MAEPQTIQPLTDEEILAVVKDDPGLVAKFTSEERRRLSRLQPNVPRMNAANPLREEALATLGGEREAPGVTLGDYMADPRAAMGRMGRSLLSDLTDPATMLPIVAGVVGGVAPRLMRAAGPLKAGAKAAAPELAKAALGYRVEKGVSAVQKGMEAARSARPETAPGGTAPPVRPPAEPTPAAPPAAAGKSPQQVLNEEAIARRRAAYQARKGQEPAQAPKAPEKPSLTAAETKVYLELRARGKTDAQAKDAIEAARLMNDRYGLKEPSVTDKRFPKGMRGKSQPIRPPE